MKLRHLSLLALVVPTLTMLPAAGPAEATRADSPAPAYVVDEWASSDDVTLPDQPYTRVEVTYDATYGITLDGQVRTAVASWKNATQRADLTAPSTFDHPVVDVTGGTSFGMAIDDQGHLQTWGNAPSIPEADQTATYRDVAAVASAAIGVTTDGELRFWGTAATDYPFDSAALAAADVVSIDVDSAAAVALTSDGHLLSAGYALDGTYFDSAPFPADRADDTFTAIDTGVSFALGLTDTGKVVSWGSYQNGEDQVPTFPAGRHAVAISAGFWWAAAVLDDGSVVTWGNRESTELPALRPEAKVVDIDLDRYRSAVTYATMASSSAPAVSAPRALQPSTVTAGSWTPQPDHVEYSFAVDGVPRDGEGCCTFRPSAEDVGGTLTVTETAYRDGFVPASQVVTVAQQIQPAVFTSAPAVTVTGDLRVGGELRVAHTDSDPSADAYHLSWGVLSADDAFSPIAQATDASFRPTADLLGRRLGVRVVAESAGFDPIGDPVAVAGTVQKGTLTAPRVRVTGGTRLGQVLTAAVQSDPAADAPTYQWLRGTTPIAGATAAAYAPVLADLGRQLSVRVTSTASAYAAAAATSTPSAAITLGPTRLTVSAPRKARVGSKARITITGLAAGERFTITIWRTRASGTAGATGVGTATIAMRGKPGKRRLTVVGSLTDRTGSARLQVVPRPHR